MAYGSRIWASAMNERTDDMAQTLSIDGFLEDYSALVDPDFHDPSPDALIDMVLMAAEQATAGEPFSIWVDGECTRDHESKEFSFNIDTEDQLSNTSALSNAQRRIFMNDQVTLIGLTDFLDFYDHTADFEAGAPSPADVIYGLINSAKKAAEQGMNACDLILPSEQCDDPELCKAGLRFQFGIESSALGLVIGFERMVDDE